MRLISRIDQHPDNGIFTVSFHEHEGTRSMYSHGYNGSTLKEIHGEMSRAGIVRENAFWYDEDNKDKLVNNFTGEIMEYTENIGWQTIQEVK